MTVGEMLKRMTSLEVEEWKAYLTLQNKEDQDSQLAREAEEGLKARRAKMRR